MTSGRKNNWTAGNVLSWVLGVLVGGFLGTVLLIAVPRFMGNVVAAPAAASTETAGTASAGAGASGAQAPGTASHSTQVSTANEANEAVQTTAAGSAGTPTAEGDAAEGDAEAGKTKFAASCGGCHGMNAEGSLGPSMANAKGWSLEQFTASVRELKAPEKELKAPMMKFDTTAVSDAEMANIYAYLQTVN